MEPGQTDGVEPRWAVLAILYLSENASAAMGGLGGLDSSGAQRLLLRFLLCASEQPTLAFQTKPWGR